MTLMNLSTSWKHQPLTDPALAVEVVDLFVTDEHRRDGVLYVFICDEKGRLRLPVAVDEIDPAVAQDCALILRPFFAVLRTRPGVLLLALGRPGPSGLTAEDRQWEEVARRTCEEAGVGLIALYVATEEEVVEVTPAPVA